MIKIVLIDENVKSLNRLINIINRNSDNKIVETSTKVEDAFELYKESKPDIIIINNRNSKKSIDSGINILDKYRTAKIIFINSTDNNFVIECNNIMVRACIDKNKIENLDKIIYAVNYGYTVYDNNTTSVINSFIQKNDDVNLFELGINEKEEEIIKLVAKGLSNKEIANTVFLKHGTVRNYISEILEKLSLKSRTELVVYYYQFIR